MPPGYVAECTGDNIFIVKGGPAFHAAHFGGGALNGITRGVVLELARENGMTVSEPNLTRYDLFNADECFLTGTGAEIIAAVKIDGRVVGDGKPGPVTGRLIGQYRALTESSGEPIYPVRIGVGLRGWFNLILVSASIRCSDVLE